MNKARKFINQSYSVLQTQTGIDRAVWSRYFNGKQDPTLKRFEELAAIAGCSTVELFKAFMERRKQ